MSDVTESIEKLTKAVHSLSKLTVDQHEENRRDRAEDRRRFGVIEGHIRGLWKRLDGEEPPHGPNGSLPPIPKKDPRAEPEDDTPIPLDEHVSNHDMSIAGLESRVIVLDRKFDKMAVHINKSHEMQAKQSKAMGIDLGFFKYLTSKEGIRAIGVVIAAGAALLAAINTSWSNYQQSKQQQQQQHVTQAP